MVRMTRAARATFRDVFAVREFRALWLSVILSAAGDRLALVALAVMVYERTRSPLLAAVAYAAGYLPWVIGGLFLADLADRYPRRTVMVTCDAVRAVLAAAMAVPGLPVVALVLLLFAATMFASPFEAARASITPGILPGERYALGTAVMQTTYLIAEVTGAAAGGAVVTLFGVRPSLIIDAATFVVSGLLIGLGTRVRPAAAGPGAAGGVVVAQGAALVAAGAAAQVVTPSSVIAAGGAIGALLAVALTFSWRRVASPRQLPAGLGADRYPEAGLLTGPG
jgi:MFS family permease